MTLHAAASFCLLEQGKCRGLADLIAAEVPTGTSPTFLEVKTTADNSSDVVFQIITALLYAQQLNIPVILNRTSQQLDLSALPTGFSIGLLTSGTTGKPKLVFHAASAITPKHVQQGKQSRWLLCYHPMSFAGLQVVLQALLSGDTLISDANADVQTKAKLALTYEANCLSLTPSLFKAMSLCWGNTKPPLLRITFGGEICGQDVLSLCQHQYPQAEIRHIYALTEAGVIFSVKDGKAGFPANWLEKQFNNWTLLLNDNQLILQQASTFIHTGDRLQLSSDRCYFIGRADNVVNVGGVKVDLEQVEQHVLQLPAVRDARVFAKKSPITGAILAVELLSTDQLASRQALDQLNLSLAAAERLRLVQFVSQITLSETGKKQRIMS